MTPLNNPLFSISFIFALVLAGMSAAHADSHELSAAYVFAGDKYLLTGRGNCVRASGWTPETAVPACEGLKEAMAPEPEQAPDAVAVVTPPPTPVPEPDVVIQNLSLSGDTNFATNSAQLTGDAQTEIRDLVDNLRGYDKVSGIVVSGHTDSRGSDQYNQGLSLRRAESVKQQLVREGVNPAIITTNGFGESKPVASNDTKDGRAKNRRVELEITAQNERVQ
ncbi:MAG: OmpA family protein [Gammaproteobacteria bacterium]